MAGLTNLTKDALLDHFGTLATHASLHTADPGSTGTSEVPGGSYARKPLSWAPASSGSKSTSAGLVFDVPGGGTVITHLGYWSAATGGTFRGSRPLDAAQTYATAGTYTVAAGNTVESLT